MHDDTDRADAPISLDDFLAESAEMASGAAPAGAAPDASATLTLARYALEAALTAAQRRRLSRPGPVALLITVPSAAWVTPVRLAAEALWDFDETVHADGSQRTVHRPDKGNEEVGCALARGRRVLGVSHAPERYLPATLVAAADVRVTVAPPTPAVLRRTIRRATGADPGRLPAGLGAGLDWPDFIGAIRVGTTAASCVRRLQAASEIRVAGDGQVADAPLLSELAGYSQAMTWSEALVRDLAAWRRGEITDFRRIARTCVWASAPGLGKSSLARSLARTAGIPLVATSVAAWFSTSPGHLDGVIKAADEAFARAAALGQGGPALLFLDEIDALPDRRTLSDRGRDWWTPVVTHILLTLDAALSRPSSRLVVVGRPTTPAPLTRR